mmetsp:Transcript_24462/g.37932  ORF Transcript_24462/g.37932 Transcript_24462/m.37932 type:complete len:205 (+) Transcript_24462:63-677(+)
MVGSLQLFKVHAAVVVGNNIIEQLLIDVSVPDRKSNSGLAEATASSNSVLVLFDISNLLVVHFLGRNVVVDHELNLRHIDTSSDNVGSDKHVDLLVSELLHGIVTLFLSHPAEHDVRRQAILPELLVDDFGEVLGVDEDESLGHCASLEHIHDEFQLLPGLALQVVLLDVLQLFSDLLRFKLDYLGLLHELVDLVVQVLFLEGG